MVVTGTGYVRRVTRVARVSGGSRGIGRAICHATTRSRSCGTASATVDVPDEVTLTLEVEVGVEGSEFEVELSW
jgi:NAD(P)-dependent dehydrogenase (short-subunit alcohol dehydrogenase family)